MTRITTKSVESIENTMKGAEGDPARHKVLESARNFKTSWIDLGRDLYTVWKDKLYRGWGYSTFEAYSAKEIGIRKMTAMKLLRSYYFLEKEEPDHLRKDYAETRAANKLPNLESVNMLRLAGRNKAIEKCDYARLKVDVLDTGREPKEVRREITSLVKQREDLEPDEARARRRIAAIRRLLSLLNAVKTEMEISKLLPAAMLKDITLLVRKIESELG